jgi:RHS repeat-associated protein
VAQTLAFDAWGLRRDPTNWSALASPFAGTYSTKRGYTDHEHLDTVELVHMNGRVYDPKIGRFLSPDPIVQAPFNSQSVGRYSYVWNNPASSIDPSGFEKQPDCDGCDEVIAVGHRTDQNLSEELEYYSSGGYDPNAASAANTSGSGSADSGGGVADRPLVVHIVCDASCYQRPHQPPKEPASSPTWNNFHLGLSALSIGLDASAFGAAISWVPDLLDAGLSVAEGDWKGAGLSVAGMVPFIGTIADTAKLTRIAARESVSLEKQAAELIKANSGKSRVTLRSPSQQLDVDLAGKAHGGIPTPHTKVSPRNTQAPAQYQPAYNTSADKSTLRPATQEDIRMVRRYLESQ